MKILHILTSINTGGAEKFCVDICNVQANITNNEIYLCVLDKIHEQPLVKMISPKVTLISLNKENRYSLKIPYKIYQLLSEIKPDVIHLNGRALVYASLPIMMKQISSIYTVHTMVNRGNKYVNKYLKFLFNNFSSIFLPVAISQSVLDTVKNSFGNQFNEMIYNGSSELSVSQDAKSVSNFIDSLKMDDGTLVFVYIGRIEKVKNTLMLVKSFNKLLDDGQNVCLCIVGYDSSPSDSYLMECKNENRYSDKIVFVGRKENIADYLLCADALCMTSKSEGLGIAALEAFSMGVPLLSTPAGGPSEIITSGLNGYVSEQISVTSYVKILERFIEKPLINKLNIVKLYKENYTMEICALNYIELYRERFIYKVKDKI